MIQLRWLSYVMSFKLYDAPPIMYVIYIDVVTVCGRGLRDAWKNTREFAKLASTAIYNNF
jgi:hypothetical protein